MNKYFGYIRVSTVRQGEHGVSLVEQREAIERYAFRHELPIAEIFTEMQTAATRGRPVFSQMLKALRSGKASGVIIHKIDRGARNLRDWADLGELLDTGIEVHFANEQMDLSSRSGRLSADIQAVVAADYIRNLRDETIKGIYGRLKQGYYPMPAPLGYLDCGTATPKRPDPERAHIIRAMFDLYASGTFTQRKLAARLEEMGLRTRRGKPLTMNTISSMLRNPFYLGLIHIRKTNQFFQGQHEPIVSKYVFEIVQMVLVGKKHYTKTKHNFLFRRFIRCTVCGWNMTGETHKGITYYRCHGESCPHKYLRETTIDAQVREILRGFQMGSMRQAQFEAEFAQREIVWKREKHAKLGTLRSRLEGLNDELASLTNNLARKIVEPDIYQIAKKRLLLERCDVREHIQRIGMDTVQEHPRVYRDAVYYAHQALAVYETGFLEQKRNMLRTIISSCSYDGKTLFIELTKPFGELSNYLPS